MVKVSGRSHFCVVSNCDTAATWLRQELCRSATSRRETTLDTKQTLAALSFIIATVYFY
jgi:hypothetical protein